VLTGEVQDRLALILAEHLPRRARAGEHVRPGPLSSATGSGSRTASASRSLGSGHSFDDAPELRPSDDDEPGPDRLAERAAPRLHQASRSAGSPAATDRSGDAGRASSAARLTATSSEPPEELSDDWPEASSRTFRRAHVGVVCALLLAGLLFAGWVMLRARPVAIASTEAVPAATATSSGAASPAGRSPSSAPRPTGSATPASEILVHVLGAVREPGVVTIAERGRVRDAIKAAGGLTASADPGDLNLAQVLQDGQQIVIGTEKKPEGEVRDGTSGSGGGQSGGSTEGGSTGGGAADTVDLNRASQSQLEALPGVGPVTAAKIVAWREEHGRFSRVEELQEVDGIGPKTYAEIAPHTRV
jgi:competence protein ComEA